MPNPRIHTTEQISAFMEELKHQTDRGAGIVAAAVAEDVLTGVLRRRLVEMSNTRWDALFGRMRPLGTFSAKIELGAAIGIYDDTLRRVLNMIRDVRNHFAHQMKSASFEDPDVAKLILPVKTASTPETATIRDAFMVRFYPALLLLYGLNPSDIRIKPVGETHPELFVNMALAIQLFLQQQASKPQAPAKPPSENPERKP